MVSLAEVETRTQAIGQQLYTLTHRHRPSVNERLQDWLMVQMAEEPMLRDRLLRFLDVLAALHFDQSGMHVKRLYREFFASPFLQTPQFLRLPLSLGHTPLVPTRLLAQIARVGARSVASQFIAGRRQDGANRALGYLERNGRYPSFDMIVRPCTRKGRSLVVTSRERPPQMVLPQTLVLRRS